MANKPISFVIPDQPVSLNQILGEHWAVKSRRNKLLRDTVFAKAWEAGWRKSMPKFTRVEVIIRNWRGDVDNAAGGCKGIIDALWRNDIIQDDNPKYCEITYHFEKSDKKGKSVEIILSDK